VWGSSTPWNRVLAVPEVYRGGVNSAVIRSAEVFREAVRSNAPPNNRGAQSPLRGPHAK